MPTQAHGLYIHHEPSLHTLQTFNLQTIRHFPPHNTTLPFVDYATSIHIRPIQTSYYALYKQKQCTFCLCTTLTIYIWSTSYIPCKHNQHTFHVFIDPLPILPLFPRFVHPPFYSAFLLDCISEGERIYKCTEGVLVTLYLHGFVVCVVGKMTQDVGTATKNVFWTKTRACTDGTLKNQPNKNDTMICLHHPYILCHFANYTHQNPSTCMHWNKKPQWQGYCASAVHSFHNADLKDCPSGYPLICPQKWSLAKYKMVVSNIAKSSVSGSSGTVETLV